MGSVNGALNVSGNATIASRVDVDAGVPKSAPGGTMSGGAPEGSAVKPGEAVSTGQLLFELI